MVTMRPLDAHGKWQSKTQKEYLCRKADEERGFTAQEFLQAKEDGWEKQYKYRSAAGVSAWLTPTQAAREPGWERCSKQPKAAKFGRQNPLCARWNSPERLMNCILRLTCRIKSVYVTVFLCWLYIALLY